jgi:hypothetical protein
VVVALVVIVAVVVDANALTLFAFAVIFCVLVFVNVENVALGKSVPAEVSELTQKK